jgi:hypothetical protein
MMCCFFLVLLFYFVTRGSGVLQATGISYPDANKCVLDKLL